MDAYRTEDEQVEALRRWWDENGRSTIVAIVVALAAGFGWQGWKDHSQGQREQASEIYQTMLQAVSEPQPSEAQLESASALAEQLKAEHSSSTYARFAALHMAKVAVTEGDLAEAEAQLRWVLSKTDQVSDTGQIAQLRLARVLASSGKTDQALAILEQGGEGAYAASYAAARGDILFGMGRESEAREAYNNARALSDAQGMAGGNMSLDQKLESLSPVPPRELDAPAKADDSPLQTEASGE